MNLTLTLDTISDRTAPARVAHAMLWGIAGASALLLLWAGIAPVPEIAVAPGRVVPQRQLQTVSSLDGGSIAAILVRPGQRVAAGQLLLRLDPGSASAEAGRQGAAMAALRARIARLEAELAGG
ncbi:MAG: secretion protein HlyD, partial [Alphaproteobacteria bacterium PA4]